MSIPFEVGDTVVPRFIVGRDGWGWFISTVREIEGDEVVSMDGRFKPDELAHVTQAREPDDSMGAMITYRVTDDAKVIESQRQKRRDRQKAFAKKFWKPFNDAMAAAFGKAELSAEDEASRILAETKT
jgi:hypothetical protein